MSHIVQVKGIAIHDREALEDAIKALGLKTRGYGEHTVYGSRQTGLAVELPGWQHPVVIDPDKGTAAYDNFNGSWGKQVELDKLVQRYAVEMSARELRIAGYDVTEETMDNGDVRVVANNYAEVG